MSRYEGAIPLSVRKNVGVVLDLRLRAAVEDFARAIDAATISDAVRALLVLGLEKAASAQSSALKAGYRAGVNNGLARVRQGLLKLVEDDGTKIEAK